MSDSNGKKPASHESAWLDPLAPKQPARPVGHAPEDPLAELDRIVSQDFGVTDDNVGSSFSSEDLRLLEQQLIQELRGQQQDHAAHTPELGHFASHPATGLQPEAPASQPIAPAPQPLAPAREAEAVSPLDRPHPLARQAPAPASEPAIAPVPEQTRPMTGEEAVQAAVHAAAMPSSHSAAEAAESSSSLDDWSSLLRGETEPEAQSAAPSLDTQIPTSGSYGQLSRPQREEPRLEAEPAISEESAVADPLAGYRPGQSYAADTEVDPVASAASWPDQVAASEETYYGDPAASTDKSYASQAVPEVAVPISSDPAADPYAAFNQASASSYADPSADYAAGGSVAPDVDVTGHSTQYGAADTVYGSPVQPQAGQEYDGNYATHPSAIGDYPMASGPHGSYSDPSVAQAAAESAPYIPEEEYSALDPEVVAATAAASEGKKSRKGLIAALAAVGVIAVGGLVVWGYGQSSDSGSTETPVITAQTEPVKETPDDPGGKVIPHQNKTVYDRIDGTETDEGPSNLMPETEKPMALTANGQSPRVISLSGGESSVSQSNNSTTSPVAPKTVRTVVVRPDGTIVTSDNANAQQTQTDANSVDSQMLAATPSEQAMTQTFNNGIDSSTATQSAVSGQTGDATAPLPRAKPAELVALQAAQQSTAAVRPVQQTQAAAPAAPVQTNNGTQPLSLVPPTQAAAAPVATTAANTGSGDFTVQVTSQRTPEQARASYATIQSRLASVLSGYQPDIKEADLGARGTYYRVRVGSFADRGSANAFCNSIKAAGGDCLVARK